MLLVASTNEPQNRDSALILIWVNTVVILAVVVVEAIVIRQISANLKEGSAILSSNMKQAAETLSRLERIRLATLDRVASNRPRS